MNYHSRGGSRILARGVLLRQDHCKRYRVGQRQLHGCRRQCIEARSDDQSARSAENFFAFIFLVIRMDSHGTSGIARILKLPGHRVIAHCRKQHIEACSADQSARSAKKKIAFIFQLSGWALVAHSCFGHPCLVATRVPGSISMLKRDVEPFACSGELTKSIPRVRTTRPQKFLHAHTCLLPGHASNLPEPGPVWALV